MSSGVPRPEAHSFPSSDMAEILTAMHDRWGKFPKRKNEKIGGLWPAHITRDIQDFSLGLNKAIRGAESVQLLMKHSILAGDSQEVLTYIDIHKKLNLPADRTVKTLKEAQVAFQHLLHPNHAPALFRRHVQSAENVVQALYPSYKPRNIRP